MFSNFLVLTNCFVSCVFLSAENGNIKYNKELKSIIYNYNSNYISLLKTDWDYVKIISESPDLIWFIAPSFVIDSETLQLYKFSKKRLSIDAFYLPGTDHIMNNGKYIVFSSEPGEDIVYYLFDTELLRFRKFDGNDNILAKLIRSDIYKHNDKKIILTLEQAWKHGKEL